VLAKLSLCRTRALGGRTYQCDSCGDVTEVHHSCGDRHCPQCSGRKRFDFAERASKLILPGLTYYQAVFTLPGDLSQLAQANRLVMSDLLFSSAWKSLRKTIRGEQDYEPAAMMVLHTWNQRLQPHWHVHALVPGAGPSLSGDHWRQAAAPEAAKNSDGFYLVDAISLRESFRRHAIAHLKRLRQRGKLKLSGKFAYLQDDNAWQAFCEELLQMEWVSYIQPPPSETCSADQVIRYLTRYLTGGPISNHRIIAANHHEVTFMAREGKQVGGEREQVPVTLSTSELIGRWCDHIQPDQLTKTRYCGGWCNQHREKYLTRCRSLLGPSDSPQVSPSTSTADESVPRCVRCDEGALRLISETAKPSWRDVLSHTDPRCPVWYADLSKAAFSRYLEATYGIGYEDWHLETCLESAMSQQGRAVVSTVVQLYLPGLHPERDFVLESY
jgi:Putative transposase/Transposase zinc-binding domain